MPKPTRLPELNETLKRGLGTTFLAEYEKLRTASENPAHSELEVFTDNVLNKQVLRLEKLKGVGRNVVQPTLDELHQFLISMYAIAGKNPEAIAAKVAAVDFKEGEKEELLNTIPQAAGVNIYSCPLSIAVPSMLSSACCLPASWR